MTAPAPLQLIHEPCWLVIAPTNLGAAYPYGGTEIGFASQIMLDRGFERLRIVAEEFARKTIKSSFMQRSLVVSCNMRGHDPNLLALMPGGLATNDGTWTSNSTTTPQPHSPLTRRVLLLVPDDERKNGNDSGVAIILYAATVLPDPGPQTGLSYAKEYGTPVEFEAEIDDTGLDWDDGKLSTITLPGGA